MTISRRTWLVGLILFLTWLIFFSRTLLGRAMYFLDDLKIIYFPLEYAYAAAQAAGHLPLWNTTFGFGHPLLAWSQLSFFIPLHALLRALHVAPLTLLQVSVVAYYALGLIGMWWFLRRVRVSEMAAALGAIVFVFSGFHVGHLNHVNFYTSTMLLPYLLLAIHTLVRQPTLLRATLVSLIASLITLGGQPQIALYTLATGALYGVIASIAALTHAPQRGRYLRRLLLAAILALVLFIGLSSFTILPLREFIADTERAEGLPHDSLYEFSYPPWHAITLIAPYFYGDHTHYFGAKGFQELAAFTGILPLLLAGAAVSWWRAHRPERLFAIILVVISGLIALGRYSPLYYFLVEQHYITSVAIPGRFVFFFDIGIAILAALGLEFIIHHYASLKVSQRIRTLVLSFTLPVLLLGSFIWQLSYRGNDFARLLQLQAHWLATWGLPLLGVIGFLLTLGLMRSKKPLCILASSTGVVVITAGTLLAYSWNYNPLTTRANAAADLALIATIKNDLASDLAFPRLYTRPSIHLDTTAHTTPSESISREFRIIQPLKVSAQSTGCLLVPVHFDPATAHPITVSLHSNLTEPAITTVSLNPHTITDEQAHRLCVPHLTEYTSQTVWLSFSHASASNFHLLLEPTHAQDQQAYIIRKPSPTAEQLTQSRKPLRLVFTEETTSTFDREAVTLSRHLNVVADSSSARWIGALAIRPYREFVDRFFANDADDFVDGDGIHILSRYRELFNMAGITHLIQYVPADTTDLLPDIGFPVERDYPVGNDIVRLYRNPEAYPHAFLVSNAIVKAAADETRFEMMQTSFNPKEVVYISGDSPPTPQMLTTNQPLATGTAAITTYTNTRVDVQVTTANPAWLVLTDSTTPQWHTFIDNSSVPSYTANSLFKSAYVPAGNHTVSFQYYSPAIAQAKILTSLAIGVCLIIFAFTGAKKYIQRRKSFVSSSVAS